MEKLYTVVVTTRDAEFCFTRERKTFISRERALYYALNVAHDDGAHKIECEHLTVFENDNVLVGW